MKDIILNKQEIEHKKKELASQTLHLVQKSKFISELKDNLEKVISFKIITAKIFSCPVFGSRKTVRYILQFDYDDSGSVMSRSSCG